MPQLKQMKLKQVESDITRVEINESLCLDVINYLPISKKTEFIIDTVNQAIDDTTSTFSPIRRKVFFDLNLCKYYAGIDWEDMSPEEAYDIISYNK